MPDRTSLWWSLALALSGAIAASAAGFLACLLGAAFWAVGVITGVTLAPFMVAAVLSVRRWERENGGPATWATPPEAYTFLAALVVVAVAAILLGQAAYGATHRRLAEGLIEFVVVVPASFVATRVAMGLRPAPRPQEEFPTRLAFWTSIVAVAVFFASQVQTLAFPLHHTYAEFRPLDEFTIAMRFFILFSYPALLAMYWKRLRFLRALA